MTLFEQRQQYRVLGREIEVEGRPRHPRSLGEVVDRDIGQRAMFEQPSSVARIASSRSSPDGRVERRARVARGRLAVVTSTDFTRCRVYQHTVDYLDTPLIRSGTMSEHLDVVIVGAGISGISAAWHLQDRCPNKSYAILERRENLGGTWDLFKYPGIRSDSDMFTLGFRFKPWTSEKAIADGPSIMAYLKETVAEYGIDKHIRYSQKVVSADWSDDDNVWNDSRRPQWRRDRAHRVVPVRGQWLLQLRPGLHAGVRRLRGLRGHDHSPAALARGPRLRGQEDRRHRQWRDCGDSHSSPGQLGCRPCDHAAAFTHVHRRVARCRPVHRPDEQVAAREAGLRGQPVEEHPVPVGAVPDRPAFPEVHAQDADDHGGAAPARGLRRAEALRAQVQPVGRAAVPGAQR